MGIGTKNGKPFFREVKGVSSRYTGMDGENTACDYLTGMGAKILDRNVRLAGGEIDIIACLEGTYLFVEVKRRSSGKYGAPIASVTPAKARRILRAASLYLAMHGLIDQPVRFDVIELLPGTVRHIPGAFDGTYL